MDGRKSLILKKISDIVQIFNVQYCAQERKDPKVTPVLLGLEGFSSVLPERFEAATSAS